MNDYQSSSQHSDQSTIRMPLPLLQTLPFFGKYQLERDDLAAHIKQSDGFASNTQLSKHLQETGDSTDRVTLNGAKKQVASLDSFLNGAVSRIGAYSDLDPRAQVVAVVDQASVPNVFTTCLSHTI